MDARFGDKVVLSLPDKFRHIAKTEYDTAKSRLESKRKEKIFHSLRKTSTCDQLSSLTADLRRSAVLAMQALSNISPCSETMECVDRAPNGLAWVRVSTNLKAPDNYKDKFFVPYLGESDAQQKFSNSVAADADLCVTEQYVEDDISDLENTVKVTPVEGPHFSPGKQLRSMKKKVQRNGESRTPTSRYGKVKGKKFSEIAWDRAAKRVALEQMIKKLRLKDIQGIASAVAKVFGTCSRGEIESCYKNVIYRRQAYKESEDEAFLRQSQKADLLRQLESSLRTQPGDSLQGDSIPFFFCRQCYIYNCLEHGTQTAKPAREPPDRTKKDTATRQAAEDIESRCPDRDLCQCWCISQSTEDAGKWWQQVQKNKVLSDNVKSIVLELFASFGMDPCRISELARLFLVDHSGNDFTCHRVGYLLETLEETSIKGNKPRQATRRPRKKYRTKAPRGETESMKGGQRVDYAPCQHDGPCTAKNCRCVENGVNCEKYCSCNHNRTYGTRPDKRLPCNHAFQGCTCRSAVACISNACVCYSYGRECDPDLCRACHECRDSNKRRSCRNVGLLMGERQRTVVGRSDTHGWGAFAAADIAKGEIIGEYVGEVVSHVDADRRGILYDEIDYSFLFNITENWALDSTRLGNKLRYCNHHFKPNCTAKLMRVGGDVRVGLYAVRDIGKHEELFFDYKYKNGPAWSMPGSDERGSSSHRKQHVSAKKRASAMEEEEDNDDDDEELEAEEAEEEQEDDEEEVIPAPRKRARPEHRERGSLRQLRNSPRYAYVSNVGNLNDIARDPPHLRAREPNRTNGDKLQRGAPANSRERTSLPGTASLSVQNDVKNVAEAKITERHGVEGSNDNMEVDNGERKKGSHVSDERPSCGEGMSLGFKLLKKKPESSCRGVSTTSQDPGHLKGVPHDSQANNVIAVKSLDVSDCDLQSSRTKLRNGLKWENRNTTHKRSSEKQRIDEPSKLRDVFGSDLESLDENANQSDLNATPQVQVDLVHDQPTFSGKSHASRFASAPGLKVSSDNSTDSKETQPARRHSALSSFIRRTKDESSALVGIKKVCNQRSDKSGKTRQTQSNVVTRGCEITTKRAEMSELMNAVRRAEVRSPRNGPINQESLSPRQTTQDRSAGTAPGLASKLNDGHILQNRTGKAPSEVPHINLVSDDEENPNPRSSRGTSSNYSRDISKS